MSVPSRRPFVAGNWKMNLTETAAGALADEVRGLSDAGPVDVGVAPPFPFLRRVLDALAGSQVSTGAQNVHAEPNGAFTGEVAAPMLRDMGVGFVIVGHSERRTIFGETDASVRSKTRAVLAHGMIPVVCVGESEAERLSGRTLPVVERQLRGALDGLEQDRAGSVVIAYEPVWAIGTGRVPTLDQITEVHAAIRATLGSLVGPPVAAMTRILYGGSVTDRNASEILPLADVDGALVGGASLDARRFLDIVGAAC